MLRSVLLQLSTRPALGRALERLPLTRRLVRRFVAGERPEDALAALARLQADGVDGAVTYLGENVTSAAAARAAADVYAGLLDEIHRRRLPAEPSLKLTQLGLDLGDEVARENLERLLDRAGPTRVWIDMEGSAYTDRTLALYRRLRARWPALACVVQAYLYRTEEDLRALIPGGPAVRLCKGAYREPPERAFPRRADVDRNYARLAGLLLSDPARRAGVYPAFATHDEGLLQLLLERARALGVGPERFEVQVLYGVRPDLRRWLRAAGARVRVLVPFGEDWYGYFVRRLAERPANLLFVLRELAG